MRSALQLLGGVAIAGVVATGGTAFTAAGMSWAGGTPPTGFVGGSISQTVTGAQVSSVGYTLDATNNTKLHAILVTFADAITDAKTPTVAFTGGTPAWTGTTGMTCTAIESTNHTSTCTANGGTAPDGVNGFTTLTVTVV